MREIHTDLITEKVAELCMRSGFSLSEGVREALREAADAEVSPQGIGFLNMLEENCRIASEENIPLCQDCGVPVFFVEMGRGAAIVGGSFEEAVNRGVREGYHRGYLRKSMVDDPVFSRENTKDNTPAVIYTDLVEGDRLTIVFMAKGGGSENRTALKMMNPDDGPEGIRDFVVKTAEEAGSSSCPPLIAGVGIGGTADKAVILSKKATLRRVGSRHPDEKYQALEKDILDGINRIGTGPGGLGGKITCLSVMIETFPCHMACLPVAVSLQCHSARHGRTVL